MKQIKLYNTLTRSLEDFKPLKENVVTIYSCGPTVYSTQHIGNMRSAYFADIVKRTLKYLGYNPVLARNYTDVGHLVSDEDSGEDKLEKGAAKENLTVWEVAQKYINQFDHDVESLGTEKPDYTPRATEYIEEQIELVQKLLDKNFAYITDEAVYFDVLKAKDYTRLSGQKLEENLENAGHGDDNASLKRSPYDFALWFFRQGEFKDHSMHWPSNFTTKNNPDGDGFPGWHIECSAMIHDILGDKIDIHIGGIEHIPTHHTNEIAQSDNALDVDNFVSYWLHFEHLLIDGKKMSKSGGTSYVMKDLEDKGFTGLDLRYFFLNAHYKSQQNFTWDGIKDAQTAREKLTNKFQELKNISNTDHKLEFDSNKDQMPYKEKYREEFKNYLANDFNTSGALSVIWTLLKDNELESDTKADLLLEFSSVLGLQVENSIVKHVDKDIKDKVEYLITERNQARDRKDFAIADEIKKQILDLGVEIKDTPEGTTWIMK